MAPPVPLLRAAVTATTRERPRGEEAPQGQVKSKQEGNKVKENRGEYVDAMHGGPAS